MSIAVSFIVVLLIAAACILLIVKGPKKVREKLRHLIDGNGETHTEIKKHRIKSIAVLGGLFSLVLVISSLCVGPTKVIAPWDAFGSIYSVLCNGVQTADESLIIYDRLPRTIAAFGVGIGLSLAGIMYQAVIRNPLCDPYIMGISSGAGMAAVAAIVFDFSLFGLLSQQSPYTTAILAIIGGLLAFFLTTLLAERAGGTTNSYVLSGVVIGLIFSAIQTIMIVFAGNKVSSALLWLFGSFANVSWSKAVLVLLPVLVLSLFAMKWAKEFNLILLGENQARQMGLNTHRFSVSMLILASVITSICVAFVGIIGFVGLVVPHLCRMMFGGDHRLLMPSSMLIGGSLMILADLAARILDPGVELPVGSITTLIGVPVFAYLLFKKGKMYNG